MNVTLGLLSPAGGSFMGLIIYMAAIFGIMWLIVIRPQKKRDRQVTEMQNAIKIGDDVLLNTGLYGKVVDIVNDLFIIELGLNKSVRIPVKKVSVAGVEVPNLSIAKPVVEETYEEEEYEEDYDDDYEEDFEEEDFEEDEE